MVELIIFIFIVILSLIGFYNKIKYNTDKFIISSNILFILYGLFMFITKK
jgi:hypothetical protein